MNNVARNLVAFGSGLVFSVGLAVSGMTRPSKVLGFLDVTGAFDPSLAMVMVSGIGLLALAWAIARRMRRPLLGGTLPAPPQRVIDARLVGGAALFGVGWGISGFCPAPALVAVGQGMREGLVFTAAMVAGMWLWQRTQTVSAAPPDRARAPAARGA